MADDDQSHTATSNGFITVSALARLARRELTTPQLIDLIEHLELELITRCTPPADWLVAERPRMERLPRQP
jgi:hypothetical protein